MKVSSAHCSGSAHLVRPVLQFGVLEFFIINSHYHRKPPTLTCVISSTIFLRHTRKCTTAKLHLFIYYVYANVDHGCLVTSENYWQRVNFRAQLHTLLLVHAGRQALSLSIYPEQIVTSYRIKTLEGYL